jgi:predicted DNA binding CopG/RHH family protein
MKRKIQYTDEPLEMEVIEDFLPPPEKLIQKEETVKITINLSKTSVEFFKKKSREQHTHYQKMIRWVLDLYAERYQ